MISRKQWVVLLCVFILYLLLGAAVFLYTERSNEIEKLTGLHKEQRRLTVLLSHVTDYTLRNLIKDSIALLEEKTGKSFLLPNTFRDLAANHMSQLEEKTNFTVPNFTLSTDSIAEIIINGNFSQFHFTYVTDENRENNQSWFDKFWEETELDQRNAEAEAMWTLYNSFFFSFQTITTIGFGQMSPSTDHGKGFLLAYATFGIPFNGIVFASLADLFSKKFVKKIDNKRYEVKLLIVMDAILYFIPGIFIFFVTPAGIFMVVEGWSYLSSMYYSFVTLSTIGFGDMVSGYVDLPQPWIWVYRLFIHAWIIFGLGYLLMIITFIQSALRSKQLRKIDRKMAKIIKQKKVRQEANIEKDLDKLRYILKAINLYQEKDMFHVNDIKEETDNYKPTLEVSPGKVNEGYVSDDNIDNKDSKMANPQIRMRKASKEMDSIEIFLNIAASVLKESERKELVARIEDSNSMDNDPNSLKKKSNLNNNNNHHNNNNNHNHITHTDCKDSKAIKEENDVKQDDKEEPEKAPSRRMSIKRTLSSWTLNILPLHHNTKESSEEDMSTENSQDDNEEEADDPNHINNLGELIDKVEELVSQEICETNENVPERNRSFSIASLSSMHRQNRHLE